MGRLHLGIKPGSAEVHTIHRVIAKSRVHLWRNDVMLIHLRADAVQHACARLRCGFSDIKSLRYFEDYRGLVGWKRVDASIEFLQNSR